MIVRDRPSGLRLFFVLKGSILSRIWIVLLVNIVLAVVVTAAQGDFFTFKMTLTAIPFTLLGLPLAIFFGFRNNAAYDRYWEGRKLWGQLIADSRNLARQCQSLIQIPPSDHTPVGLTNIQTRMIYRAIAYAHTLRHQLRDTPSTEGLSEMLQEDERQQMLAERSKTNFLMNRMGADLGLCIKAGHIDACLAANIDKTLSGMATVGAGCERIKNTPIPFSYTLLLHRTAYLYCFLLPFGLVDSIGLMTPFVVALVAYTFFGLDALGDEIEEPFGKDENDLPLETLCHTIEHNLRASLGESLNTPEPMPVNYCLK